MDGQNFSNGQSTEPVTGGASGAYQNNASGVYQDNTSAYTSDAYSSAPVQTADNGTPGLAIGALVCGIIGIVTGCCGCLGTIFGIAGLIMAIVSNNKQKSGVGTAAIVCSIIAIVLGLIMGVVNIVAFMAA